MSGLLVAQGERPLGLFELTPYGLAVLLAGGAVLVLAAPRLMPDRQSETVEEDLRDFSLPRVVAPGGPLVGRTVTEAGLRNLEGTFLVHLSRAGEVVAPVGPQEVLQAGDQLTFVGNLARAVDLQAMPGLLAADTAAQIEGGRFFEAVLSPGSAMVGQTPKEVDFRARFDSAIVAVHRAGERVTGKLGQIRLRGGDVLLLLSGPDAAALQRGDFLVVAPVAVDPPVRRERSRLVLLVLLGFLAAVISGQVDVVHASLGAAVAVIGLRILTPAQAGAAVDLDVLVTLCASFGLGAAVAVSGLAESVAGVLVDALSFAGERGVLVGVLLATVLLTQVVTNNAAAIVMFPIAVAAAGTSDVRPFVLAVVLGASLSFLTTFGYQTNLIVAGLGNYRARDFLGLGGVLLLVCVAVLGTMLSLQL